MKQLKTRVPALLGPHPKDRHGAGFSRDKEESALDQKGGLWAASGGTEVCDSPAWRQGSGLLAQKSATPPRGDGVLELLSAAALAGRRGQGDLNGEGRCDLWTCSR